MEHAIFVTDLESIDMISDNYSRVYFGQEFCHHLMFDLQKVKKAVSICEHKDKKLTLVTPIMTEGKFKELKPILDYLVENCVQCELIINDWGLLYYLNEYYSNEFTLVLGRLLNKVKKSPLVLNIIEKLKKEQQLVLRSTSSNLRPTWDVLKKNKIVRVEFENILQENIIDMEFPFEKSLNYPYVFMTTSRRCMTDFVFQNVTSYNLNSCKKSCKDRQLELYNEVFGKDIILKGNTYYYINEEMPARLDQFSRLVYQFNI